MGQGDSAESLRIISIGKRLKDFPALPLDIAACKPAKMAPPYPRLIRKSVKLCTILLNAGSSCRNEGSESFFANETERVSSAIDRDFSTARAGRAPLHERAEKLLGGLICGLI
jgi:hypothetical protein